MNDDPRRLLSYRRREEGSVHPAQCYAPVRTGVRVHIAGLIIGASTLSVWLRQSCESRELRWNRPQMNVRQKVDPGKSVSTPADETVLLIVLQAQDEVIIHPSP